MKKIAVCVAAILLAAGTSQAEEPPPGSICSKHVQHRTTLEVFQAHVAALMTADADVVACDYAEDAYVILPGSVAKGVADITAAFRPFLGMLGPNAAIEPVTLTIEGEVVLLEWRAQGAQVVIGDGVDTIVVRDGLIVAQTVRLGDLSSR